MDTDYVLIVPAGKAYGQYLQNSAYACDSQRNFWRGQRRRPPDDDLASVGIRHVAFFTDQAIQIHVPLIRYRERPVTFSQNEVRRRRAGSPNDQLIAQFIAARLADGTWIENGLPGQVILLSGPRDKDTVRLAQPIINDLYPGWCQDRRYKSLAQLTQPGVRISDL